MVRRLARRKGPTTQKGDAQQEVRRAPQHQNAKGRGNKKSPPLGDFAALAGAYVESWPRTHHHALAAAELARRVGPLRVHQLTDLHIIGLCNDWKKRYSPHTYYDRVRGLHRFLRHLEQITGNPARWTPAIPRARYPGPRQVTASPLELAALRQAAAGWQHPWLTMAINLGARATEILRIAPEHYDAETQTVTFTTKGGGTNTLPVLPEVAAVFAAAPPCDDPTVPYLTRWAGRPLNYHTLNNGWQRLKKRAGVRIDLRIHDLRRTVATKLYDLTKDLRAVQQLLGHQHISSTTHYIAARDPQVLRPLLAQLWTPKGEKPN